MKQVILRIRSDEEDVEMLQYDTSKKSEMFSKADKKTVCDFLTSQFITKDKTHKNRSFTLTEKGIIAFDDDCIIVNQPEHNRIVIYDNKSYRINFPNSIYIIRHDAVRILDIEAFMYAKYEGVNTVLFKYAMPNMLGENKICMGSADKKIKNNDPVDALENIIFATYSHRTVNNIKSFSGTESYFEYLEKNSFPYELLMPLDYTLEKAMRG